jgi:ABC-type Mn2+/Zn2+ transport system permease subunit
VEFLTDPAGWWIEPFTSNDFMRNALWAGLLAVLATSTVGTWVVLRGMSFLGDALAHGVLPGIAVAFIVGVDTSIGALVAALAMVGGISLIRSHTRLPEDTSIGVLFVGFLALAVVIMSSGSASYTGDLNRFLFGSITGIQTDDLLRQAVAAAISVVGVVVFYRAFLVMTFDETQARLLGLRPRLAHAALLVLLAVSIVASFETVGNLLVFAFLVAPPATATLLVRRVPLIMATAVGLGAVAVIVGLLVSYHHDTAAGASMALTAVVLFLTSLAATALRDHRQHPAGGRGTGPGRPEVVAG